MSLFNWKKKEEPAPEHLYNNDEMLFARLLFETNPQFDDTILLQEISKQFSQVEPATHDRDDARQYFFRDYMASFKEGSLPAQCTIFRPGASDIQKSLEKAYQQLWHWREAKEQTAQSMLKILGYDK